MTRSWYPNCGACCEAPKLPTCLLHSDNFNDGILDPIWVQQSGIWTEINAALRTTSTSARIYTNTGRGITYRIIFVELNSDNYGDKLHVYTSFDSTWGSYFGAEFEIGGFGDPGFMKVVDSIGTFYPWIIVESDIISVNTWFKTETCYFIGNLGGVSNNIVHAKIRDASGGTLAYTKGTVGATGYTDGGLGTAPQTAVNAAFDNYTETIEGNEVGWAHCPNCIEEPFCWFPPNYPAPEFRYRGLFINGISPYEWLLDIRGIAPGVLCGAVCDTDLNGFYTLGVYTDKHPGADAFECEVYELYALSQVCYDQTDIQWSVELRFAGADDGGGDNFGLTAFVVISASENYQPFVGVASFTQVWETGVRAQDINNTNIPNDGGPSGNVCDGTNATCALTAIMA